MDKINKKRVTIGEVGEGQSHRFKKLKAIEDGGAAADCTGDETTVPSEEEVEEFYAILRRMRVVVKYFNEKGRVGKNLKEVLEQAEVTVVHDDGNAIKDDNHLESGCATINKGLDLNVVAPEAAEGNDT